MVRHTDQDGVHLFHVEQFAMVGEALGFGRHLLGGVDLGAVDIADRRHIHGSGFDEFAHVAAAALAAADEAELHALVGAEDMGVGKCSGGSHAAQKCPSWDIVIRHDHDYMLNQYSKMRAISAARVSVCGRIAASSRGW
jgi:hypothetical protein